MTKWMRYGFLQAPVFADAATGDKGAGGGAGDGKGGDGAGDKGAGDKGAGGAGDGAGAGDKGKGGADDKGAAGDKGQGDKGAGDKGSAGTGEGDGNKDGKGGDSGKGKEGEGQPPPKAPKDFKLTVPEGGFLTANDLERVKTAAEIYGWTEEQTQQEINLHSSHVKALSESFLTEAKADPEYGGAKFDETRRLADLALNRIRPAGHPRAAAIHSLLNRSGYNHNVEVLALLADFGRMFSEDGGLGDGDKGGNKGGNKPLDDPLAEAERQAQKLYGKTNYKA